MRRGSAFPPARKQVGSRSIGYRDPIPHADPREEKLRILVMQPDAAVGVRMTRKPALVDIIWPTELDGVGHRGGVIEGVRVLA